MSRYVLGVSMTKWFAEKSALPMGTLTVNILGSMLMGVLIALFTSRGEMDSKLRMVVTIGFLGGFTTYSSFALETVELLEKRNVSIAGLYVFLSVVGGTIACVIGLMMGRRL